MISQVMAFHALSIPLSLLLKRLTMRERPDLSVTLKHPFKVGSTKSATQVMLHFSEVAELS